MASTATKVWFGQSKRATLFKGTCFKILLLIFACFLETASQSCVGRWHWHCLQVSLWNFCIWRSFWWPRHVVIGASALALRYARGLIFFRISSVSNFRGGLPKESLRLDQSFQNNLMKTYFSCRAFWISMPLVTLWTQISLKYAAEAVREAFIYVLAEFVR